MMTLTIVCLLLLHSIACQEEFSNDTGSKAENLAMTALEASFNSIPSASIL
jgi:hypothetical protein